MEKIRRFIKKILPRKLFNLLQPYYHFTLAWLGAQRYRHPSREIKVIAVTGTKGKSSVTEIVTHLLRSAGYKTASLSTIQFSIGDHTERNLFKMTMPGRFFVQNFLRRAVDAGCEYAVIEMTSEGAKQFRHRFIDLDALIFTNLTPEHIESHGSFAKYKEAKLSLVAALAKSPKRPRYLVVNIDDEHGPDFLDFEVENKLPYSLKDLDLYTVHKDGISLVFGDVTIRVPLIGLFNVYNTLAAISLVRALGVPLIDIQKYLHDLPTLKGRVEQIKAPAGAKNITAVIDYAHTPDSLTKLYEAFPQQRKICVLGNTGGGRDTWKRPEMGAIAEKYCAHIILTNEDPYDEDPQKIVDDMRKGMSDEAPVEVIMDRKEAIERAVEVAKAGDVVLISGKGTDPYIMGPNGSKTPWSDAAVTREILDKLSRAKTEEIKGTSSTVL